MKYESQRIESQRLVLRPPRRSDAAEIFARYANDPAVTRYLAWPRHESVDQAHAFLDFSESQWRSWPAGPYLIEARDSGALLGGTGLQFLDDGTAETGYVLARDAWGLGYATEAVTALLTHCTHIGIHRVIAACHREHVASQRVLDKCGFMRTDAVRELVFPNLSDAAQRVLTYAWQR